MFRMLGRKVELVRYIVSWQDSMNDSTIDNKEHCISEEHKNEIEISLTDKEIEFTTETVDQKGNEWFNGLEFDSYNEAMEVFNLGETAYLQRKMNEQSVSNLQLRADTDYLAIMMGVDI